MRFFDRSLAKNVREWGSAKGYRHFRTIPRGVKVVRRETTLRWTKSGKLSKNVTEKRTVVENE